MAFGRGRPGTYRVPQDRGYKALQPQPGDTISRLRWHPNPGQNPILLGSSWDGHVQAHQLAVGPTMTQTQTQMAFEAQLSDMPILDVIWSPTNNSQFIMATANRVEVVDVTTKARTQLGIHDGYVTGLTIAHTAGNIATCGLDGIVKFWDQRSPPNTPVGMINIGIPLVGIDCLDDDMVTISHPGYMHWITPTVRQKVRELKTQKDRPWDPQLVSVVVGRAATTDSLDTVFAAAGRVDMRVQIWWRRDPAEQMPSCGASGKNSYLFRPMMRDRMAKTSEISQLNSMCIDPLGQLVTVTGCGSCRTWSVLEKAGGTPAVIFEELRVSPSFTAVAATQWNNHILYAAAEGYDWSRGGQKPQTYTLPQPRILIKDFEKM